MYYFMEEQKKTLIFEYFLCVCVCVRVQSL